MAAPSAQLAHVLKQKPFIARNLALENIPICSCFGLSRPLFVLVSGLCYCVARVVLNARAAYGQPGYRPVPPKVAIGIVALLTVVAGC